MTLPPFQHAALVPAAARELVYTAMSKHLFYLRAHISRWVVLHKKVPLNPFMLFDYFLLDSVDRQEVRLCNNTLVERADEIWVFGAVSNGVLAEIKQARDLNKPVCYFHADSNEIVAIGHELVAMEADVEEYRSWLAPPL